MTRIKLSRPPRTDDELWALVHALWGVKIPRVAVCEGHVAPFTAFSDAYFARHPGYAVWYASRGSGKSLLLATLGLTKTFVADVDTTILGGSMTQSQNVTMHMDALLEHRNAPLHAMRSKTATALTTTTGRKIRPLPASQTTVRGPHPPLSLLDECDEMEYAIYEAALGQAMEQMNSRGEVVGEYIVASSTWQNPDGTFTKIIENAREKGLPVHSWCMQELLAPNGWMSAGYMERKRAAVSAEMWTTEYLLGEPSGSSRAFDMGKVEEFFIDYDEPIEQVHKADDDEWTWERPELGLYACGADWAKEVDKTVIAVVRYDVSPRRLVYLRRFNRRPYPEMIGAFDAAVARYGAVAAHDGTGLGNVVHDFMQSVAAKFVMVGRARTELLAHYITDFEHGGYRLPRSVAPLYRAHRTTTTDDVYAPAKWDAHLPDEVAAMALAHRAAGRIGAPAAMVGVDRSAVPRQADADFHVVPFTGQNRLEGVVSVVDERYDDVSVFWLSPEVARVDRP